MILFNCHCHIGCDVAATNVKENVISFIIAAHTAVVVVAVVAGVAT